MVILRTATTRLGPRLDNPDVVRAIDVKLWAAGSQLCQQCLHVTAIILHTGNWHAVPDNIVTIISVSQQNHGKNNYY